MSDRAEPSNETLKETFRFGESDKLEVQFHNLYKAKPEWADVLTPIFVKDGVVFHTYDTLWEDLQETETVERITNFIVKRFNEEVQKLDDSNEEMSWNDALLLFFRTRVLYLENELQVV